MAANLVQNMKKVLKGFPAKSVYGWLDSTVALHWIRGNGDPNSSWEIEWGRFKKNKHAREKTENNDVFDELLEKRKLWRVLQVGAWIGRFLHNKRTVRKQRVVGPLIIEEIQKQNFMDQASPTTSKFEREIWRRPFTVECARKPRGNLNRGRIQGHYPIFLSDSSPFTRKLVHRSHVDTTRRSGPYHDQSARAILGTAFKSTRGYRNWFCRAHQVPYQSQNRRKGLSCIVRMQSYTRIIPGSTTKPGDQWIPKKLKTVHRAPRAPEKIYSDNGKTFVGAEKWLKQVMRDEKTQNYLPHENIKWQFNLSRAALWGGQFECLIGLVKTALNKTIGCGMLTRTELCEVVLDVEIALNNRPLCYVEDDIQLPVLTPNSLLFLRSNQLPELEPHHLREFHLRRRAKYLRRCNRLCGPGGLPNIYEGWENDTGWNTRVKPRPWPKERWSPSRRRNEIAINGQLHSWKIWFRDETESFELPNVERGKEHSNGQYNIFTHWSCPAIGRLYRLLRNSTRSPDIQAQEGCSSSRSSLHSHIDAD